MKTIKYAIYKTSYGGLSAIEYLDTPESIKPYPYIKSSSLPVLINSAGGYCSFVEEYEVEDGFLYIVEVDEDAEPLTCNQRYPKNSDKFEYGWIDTEGNTYNTAYKGHMRAADYIHENMFGKENRNAELTLEKLGWLKVSRDPINHNKKFVYVNMDLTQAQINTLYKLGLDSIRDVRFAIKCSQGD